MMVIACCRSLSWISAFTVGRPGEEGDTSEGRQDKSTAVGRGACGWLYWVFSAARQLVKAALLPKTLTISMVQEPSPVRSPRKTSR